MRLKNLLVDLEKESLFVNTGGDYPQAIKLEAHKDNITKLDGINVGDNITCAININGRLWEGNYYNNIVAWKIDTGASAPKSSPVEVEEDADLPF